MSITSTRTIQVGFSGAIGTEINQSALENAVSPANSFLADLGTGNNPITLPDLAGLVTTGITIIPPPGNTVIITLKGASGDTGIPLHITDPSSFGVDPTLTEIILTVASDVESVIVVFS